MAHARLFETRIRRTSLPNRRASRSSVTPRRQRCRRLCLAGARLRNDCITPDYSRNAPPQIRVKIANPRKLITPSCATARVVLESEGVPEAQISLAFVDNPTIHRLNKQFLNHDEPTDVLSFPMSGPKAKCLEGELVIGAEVAKAQADERGHDVAAELGLYVIHGLLHLCGYDDHDEGDAKKMRERERHYLRTLGIRNLRPVTN